MRCPQCANKVLQKSDDGSMRMRAKGAIVFTPDGLCKAQCFWCSTEITVQATLTKSLEPRVERFVLVKSKVLTPAQ